MQNNLQKNRYSFFNGASGLGRTLIFLMWILVILQATQQFCQIVFSTNDSEEIPEPSKPYLPFIMAFISILQGTFIFSRKELQKNVKKLDLYIQGRNTEAANASTPLLINESKEPLDNDQIPLEPLSSSLEISTAKLTPQSSWFKKLLLGGSIAIKGLSILAKGPVSYFQSIFETKILLTDPLLLNWEVNSLQVLVIKHVIASIDTLYDLGTENAATIESLVKSISPHYSATSTRKCQCKRCCAATAMVEGLALLGAGTHSAKEAFTFCLFLVTSGLAITPAASIAALSFLAMSIQNYAFQGREFVNYVTKFIDYVIGAPTDLKNNYIKIKNPVTPLNGKQKVLLALLNLMIGVLVTAPSAISHFILAKLTLSEGGEAFWKYWFGEAPSAEHKELIALLSNIGVADAINDAGTESVETHFKASKMLIKRMQTTSEPANDEEIYSANDEESAIQLENSMPMLRSTL